MCYIASYIGTKSMNAAAIGAILPIAEMSGRDGRGLYANGRRTLSMGELVDDFARMARTMRRSHCWLYHARWATAGALETRNLHPFKKGQWYIAHNGHISSVQRFNGESDTAAWVRQSFSTDSSRWVAMCTDFVSKGYGSLVWTNGSEMYAFKHSQTLEYVKMKHGAFLGSRDIPFAHSFDLFDNVIYKILPSGAIFKVAKVEVPEVKYFEPQRGQSGLLGDWDGYYDGRDHALGTKNFKKKEYLKDYGRGYKKDPDLPPEPIGETRPIHSMTDDEYADKIEGFE